MLNHGDWAVYECGSKREIGRVWKVYEDRCSVCYHQGCTAAMTPISMLRPYDRDKDADLVPDARIGYHRFDRHCPEYDRRVWRLRRTRREWVVAVRKAEMLRTGWRLITENEPPAKTDVLIANSTGHPCVATRCVIRHYEKPDVLTDGFYVPATGKYRFPMYWKPIDTCDTQLLRDAADYADHMSKETTSEKCAVAFSDIARKIRKAINIEGGASQ